MNRIIYKLLIVFFISSFGLMAQSQKQYQKTFSVDENTRLKFDTNNVDVTFKTWNKDEVKVDFKVNFKNYSEEEIKDISNGIVVYAAMQSTMGDTNYLQISNTSPQAIGNLSYKLRSDGMIKLHDFKIPKKQQLSYKTVKALNKVISERSKGFDGLDGYVVFKKDSVALKNIATSNHEGIKSIRATYVIHVPEYMMMDVQATHASVHFDGVFTNEILGGFADSTLKAGELNHVNNSINFRNGSLKIKKIVSGNYAFRNVTEGLIGSIEDATMYMEFSKFQIGEITQKTEFTDFKSDITIYNLAKDFELITMQCEYSDIKLYTKKDQEYYMEAVGHNAFMNDDGVKISMQPNREGTKHKMFSRGDKETAKNVFMLDLVHGFITLHYIK